MTKAIISILLIGASVMTFMLYIQPTYGDIQEGRTDVKRFDEALAKTREIQELKNAILSKYNLFTGESLDRLQKMIPDHVDNVRLVLDMDGIASQYGIRIQNVSIQDSKNGKDDTESGTVLNGGATENQPYQSITLQFEVVSTYDNFVRLMDDLESSLRIVNLVSLSVNPQSTGSSGSSSSEPLYTFGVSLRTYWLP